MSKYPEDAIQTLVTGDWWLPDAAKTICRGALVQAYVQFFSQVPFELITTRIDPADHNTAFHKMQPLYTAGRRSGTPSLPVAAMPQLNGADCFIANRAKRRPCLVLGAVERKNVDPRLVVGMVKDSTHDFFLVAPYYSVAQEARSGYNPEFVERIRHAEYSRYFWDSLPHSRGHETILRFDQIQPVGFHHQAHEHLGYKLSPGALALTDEWLNWMLHGKDGDNLRFFRDLIKNIEAGS